MTAATTRRRCGVPPNLAIGHGFEARRAEARRRGRCRGIGIAASIELNTGAPRERAEMTIDPAGIVELVLGTMSAGQGHETSFAQVVSEWLGVDPDQVRLVTGDTDRVQAGGGSASARSMRLGSWVTAIAADQIVEKGRRIAAVMLEVSEEDVEFARQSFCGEGHRPFDRPVRGRRRCLGRCRSAGTARAS